MTRYPHTLLFALLFAASLPASAAGINDTGQTLCYDAAGTPVTCTTASAANRDDGRYGRDAAATAGVLPKTGCQRACRRTVAPMLFVATTRTK